MLFDLRRDGQERHNVIEKHPERAAKMRQEIDQLVRAAPAAEASQAQQISAEDQAKLDEQLRALGYL